MKITKIAVIGAGIMGHGIAHVFAQNNLDVVLVDTSDIVLEQAKKEIISELELLKDEDLILEELDEVLSRIKFSTNLVDSVADVDYVAEAVSENMDLKKGLFRQLDTHCSKRTIFASNTSFLPIRDLAAVTERPEKVIGAHYFNPPHIMPLVELVPTNMTSEETIENTIELHVACRKAPALLKKDVHGFLPRMLAVLQNEAIRCLEEGLATAEEIDKMICNSLGFRLSTLGPLRSLDYWDLSIFQAATDHLVLEYESERYRSPALVKKMVEEGRVSMTVGKGFYDYSDVDITKLRLERDRKYCKQLKMLREVGAI